MTMRSDFLGNAAAFTGLPELINQSLFLTPRLSPEQLADSDAGNAGWQRDLMVSSHKLSTLSEANDQLGKSLEFAEKSYQILKKRDDEGKVHGDDKGNLDMLKARVEGLQKRVEDK